MIFLVIRDTLYNIPYYYGIISVGRTWILLAVTEAAVLGRVMWNLPPPPSRGVQERKGGLIHIKYIYGIRRRHECVSRLFSYAHKHKKTAAMHHTHAHTHTHRCSPVQVSRMYCIAGRWRRRWWKDGRGGNDTYICVQYKLSLFTHTQTY